MRGVAWPGAITNRRGRVGGKHGGGGGKGAVVVIPRQLKKGSTCCACFVFSEFPLSFSFVFVLLTSSLGFS